MWSVRLTWTQNSDPTGSEIVKRGGGSITQKFPTTVKCGSAPLPMIVSYEELSARSVAKPGSQCKWTGVNRSR